MEANFSDYDHENERHIELAVDGLTVKLWRRLEFNADYAPDVEPPEDWVGTSELKFADANAVAAFLQALGEALIQSCFSYFPDDEELSSDEAREAWAKFIAALPAAPAGSVDRDVIAAICTFPR
jgi:hypothetical protein